MTNPVTLPAGATLGKTYEYGIDVNLGSFATPQWQPFRRISAFAPTFPKTAEDVTTYDDLGSPNEDVVARGFAAQFTAQANRMLSTGLYLPELEKVLAAARTAGDLAVLDIRFYHKPAIGTPNPNDAGRAFVTVEATRQNTGNSGTEVFAITLAGKGGYTPITNPFTGWSATTPALVAVTPSGAATGALVTITGANLLGATAVKFGTVNAPTFNVINASTIVAVIPSGSAGDVPVTVTTPGGTSNGVTYTRGA